MKKQLSKKLYAFIIMMMFSFVVADAQIVYTDVNPDSINTCTATVGSPCSSMYQLDLNNDGISDFQIDQYYRVPSRNYANSYVSVSPLGSNKAACGVTLIGTFNLVCPLALASGEVIKNNTWRGTSGLMLEEVYNSGLSFTFTCQHWNSVTDKYLGLKLIVGSNTYYGWVRLDVAQSGTSFTVKDYAYNSIPDSAILAGQTCPTKVVVANAPTALCGQDSLLLTANAGVCGASSLLWSTGETTTSIVVNASGTYRVTLIDTAGNSTSDSVTVTISPLPPPTVNASGATTFCLGNSVTLSSSVNGANYLWSNGARTQSISANATGNYSVTVTDTTGCTRTSPATSVTVNSSPTPTVNANGATINCSGDSVTLASSTIGTSYLWSNNETTQSISVNTAGNYSVAVTYANGCTAMSTPKSITVNPLSVVANAPTVFCEGDSLLLTTNTGGCSGLSLLWSTGETTTSIVVNASGTYRVSLIDTAGNSTSDSITVTVNPLPLPSILPNGNDLCTEVFSSYQWQQSGADIPGETNQCYTPAQPGFFSVVVTDANGCVSSEFMLTGEQNIFSENQLSIFPNPADNHLTIALGNNRKAEVTITDITGKVIYTTIASETQKIEVNTKDFAEGVYLVQVQSAAFIATKKLVVAK